MKKIVQIIAGMLFLIFVAVCPLPPLFEVSGIVWRMIGGLLGCFLLAAGIHRIVCRKE